MTVSLLTAAQLQQHLRALGNPEAAAHSARFFKTGPGEYGAGDIFLGLRVPQLRSFAKEFRTLELAEIQQLLRSPVHEDRLVALLILVSQFPKATEKIQKELHDFYLAHTAHINNWDLVDTSAPQLVGAYLAPRSRRPLFRLARSNNLWERRIAIVATLHFIRADEFTDTLKIVELLLDDEEDLLHKACGWMLREVGKRAEKTLEAFVTQHRLRMPRTMLRYAIERFPEEKRQAFLKR